MGFIKIKKAAFNVAAFVTIFIQLFVN